MLIFILKIEYCGETNGAKAFVFAEEELPNSIKLPSVVWDYNGDDSCQMLVEKVEEKK